MKKYILLFTIIAFNLLYSQIDYETQIQPIFNANCVDCHSNGATYTGGIELTSYDDLMAGGYNTDATNVLTVLEEYIITGYMPAWGGEPLNEEDVELISQWIDEGGNPSAGGDGCILSDGTVVDNGWFGNDTGNNWCNTCFCENGVLSCTELDCGGGGNECTLSDGTVVSNGWFGDGVGDNWCNTCFCEDGMLLCTDMWCGDCSDTDNDGICDDIDECVGTWVEDIITGSCLELNDQASCVAAGCSWTNEYTGVWLWEDVCGYQGNSTYIIEDNSYCDELSGGCVSDIDEDGICEDDCGDDMPTLIFDCECSFFNPYTYTVFETTINEEYCEIWEECYCECINDVNENGICDEEEETGDDCCINPEWIDPFALCPMIWQPVMGCDGFMYGNSCEAEASGVTSWIDEFTGEETVLSWDCQETGCIAELDPTCTFITEWDPVCGCDGVTYSNSSEAFCNNIFEYTAGECGGNDEGCWEDGEFYEIGSLWFIDNDGCVYYECLDNNQWSGLIEDCNNSGCSEIPISCDGGSYQYEVSWTITDSNGNIVAQGGAPYSETICLDDDCFTINMEDSYGDGWNGNTLLVGGLTFGNSFTTGYSATDEFCTPLIIIYGCTSAYAINYNPDANVDDGSCEIDPDNCEYLLSYDSYIDFNYDNTISNYYCNYYVSGGIYTIEQAESYGYNCDCVILGCTDETATNYDETAFVDDCSCIYDNDCPSVSFNTTDSSLGWEIENSDGEIVLSYNTSGQEMSGYCGNYCFEDGCYTINMTSMWGGGWYQTTLNIGEYEYTFSTGYSGVGAFGYNSEGCITEGCTNEFADNYNADANYDDGSCEYSCEYLLTYDSYIELGYDNTVSNYLCYDYVSYYNYSVEYVEEMFGYNCDCVVTGCTDEEATNYNAEAFIDDCSCTYENDCPSISFNTTDSSIGWSINDMDGETVLSYNTSGQEMGGYCGNFCFEDGCYIINMTSTWGGGWYQTTLDIGNESFTLLNGSEGIEAFAYNTEINCEIGCTDPDASNYNENAILDDGSCVVFGCTITSACNYDPEATAFDGSCYYCYMDDCNTYPIDSYDCEGNCVDEDQDGICDNEEMIGCMDENGCNYDPNATEEGDCIYPEQYYDCDGNCINDMDTDLVCNEMDNCPTIYNPNQEDFNNDGIGDACDGIGLEEDNNFEWQIYPNPFSDYTTIQFTNPTNKEVQIQIISLSGKIIYNTSTVTNEHIIANNFSAGYYIIQLKSDQTVLREVLIVE